MSAGWQVGEVRLKTKAGDYIVAGWVNGQFALDFRVFDYEREGEWVGGWTVTHLPTGYIVRHVVGTLEDAQRFVSLIADADWSFTDAASAKPLGAVVKAAMDGMPATTFFGQVAGEISPRPPVEG